MLFVKKSISNSKVKGPGGSLEGIQGRQKEGSHKQTTERKGSYQVFAFDQKIDNPLGIDEIVQGAKQYLQVQQYCLLKYLFSCNIKLIFNNHFRYRCVSTTNIP